MNSSVVRVTEALNLAPHQTVIMMVRLRKMSTIKVILRMMMVMINTPVFSLDPFLQKGSSLQVENLSSCLSVCHHFKISNIGPLYHPRIKLDPTYHILLGNG